MLYRQAVTALWQWIVLEPPDYVLNVQAYDKLLADFIEYCWAAGHTRALAGNALSGSLAAFPEVRGRRAPSDSWYLLNAWARVETPNRAPPMPPLVCLGLTAYFVMLGDWEGAFLLAAGFDSFLRTGKIMTLTIGDVLIESVEGLGVIKLAHTKTGQRHAAFEATTVLDPLVAQLWLVVRARIPAGSSQNCFVYSRPPSLFQKRFAAGCEYLGVGDFGLRCCSLRRGGATAFFRKCGSMSLTIERGRWGSIRPARIYINDGIAKILDIQLPQTTVDWITRVVLVFQRSFEQVLGVMDSGHQ